MMRLILDGDVLKPLQLQMKKSFFREFVIFTMQQ